MDKFKNTPCSSKGCGPIECKKRFLLKKSFFKEKLCDIYHFYYNIIDIWYQIEVIQ